MEHDRFSVATRPPLDCRPDDSVGASRISHQQEAAASQVPPASAAPESINERFAGQLDRIEEKGDTEAFWEVAAGLRPDLVKAAHAGVRRYRGWLRGVTAEDVVDDAILKVYGRLERIRSTGDPRYPRPGIEYFVTVIGNTIRDCCKSANIQKTMPRGDLVTSDEGASPKDVLQRDTLYDAEIPDIYDLYNRRTVAAAAVRALVGVMSPNQRSAAVEYFRHIADGSPRTVALRSVARKYDMSPDALKAMVHRARQRARKARVANNIVLPTDPGSVVLTMH